MRSVSSNVIFYQQGTAIKLTNFLNFKAYMNLNVFGQNSQHQCQCRKNFSSTVIEYFFWKIHIKFPMNVLSILLLKGFS